MTAAFKFKGLLLGLAVCLSAAAWADTQNAPQNAHHVHKAAVKKQEIPPPLPSGPQGPVPQVPLDAMPAVAPQVSYQDGLLTIVAPNSTLADVLRSVRKHTSAEIDVPSNASERIVTRLGPAPAREVMAELLNGSRFNYILLGSPQDSNQLVRVVLVPKTADTANAQGTPSDSAQQTAQPAPEAADNTDVQDDPQPEDNPDQPAEAEQQNASPDQQVKSPQQMLQEMQQRQMQQGQPGQPGYFPGRPGVPMPQQQQQQQDQ